MVTEAELVRIRDQAIALHRHLHDFAAAVKDCQKAHEALYSWETGNEPPNWVNTHADELGLNSPAGYDAAYINSYAQFLWSFKSEPISQEAYDQNVARTFALNERGRASTPLDWTSSHRETLLLASSERRIELKAGWETVSAALYYDVVAAIRDQLLSRFPAVTPQQLEQEIYDYPPIHIWNRTEVESGIEVEFSRAARYLGRTTFHCRDRRIRVP